MAQAKIFNLCNTATDILIDPNKTKYIEIGLMCAVFNVIPGFLVGTKIPISDDLLASLESYQLRYELGIVRYPAIHENFLKLLRVILEKNPTVLILLY